MSHYNPHEFEAKWQARWGKLNPFRALNPNDNNFENAKPPYYVLDMFPYPSGSGLHVGHASGYIGTDIVARKKRMEGYNVLHPMGWDAFGLPAEQYAIQTNQHPRQTTDTNTANFKKQLKLIGLSYDWSREIDTSDPRYYKWTQWIFAQLYKKGLVYRKEMPVWWCEDLKTVLANEEVINGRSERGNYPCERRPLTQWVLKITAYAERLLADLEGLDWPASVKKMQEDWIGRSDGCEIDFETESGKKITVFTTRVDTICGVAALVLAPEHPLVSELATLEYEAQISSYIAHVATKSERDRRSAQDEMTAQFTGAFCTHPLIKNKKIPIYIADYVLVDYGTGAVMSVPAHDQRDFLFAEKSKLHFIKVISPKADGIVSDNCYIDDGFLINSNEFSGLSSQLARDSITKTLEALGAGRKKITYKIRDWIFSRQRYWGEPFPLFFDGNGNVHLVDEAELPIELPPMDDFKPSPDGQSPLARATDWVNSVDPLTGEKRTRVTDTMPGWAGSCWYYLRFMDPTNNSEAFSKEAVQYWRQVDLYVGGASHAVMHLLYSRFWHKVLFDLDLVPESEPYKRLFNQGMVTAYAFKDHTGRLVANDDVVTDGNKFRHRLTGMPVDRFISKMAKSLKNVVNPDDVIRDKGCDVFRLYSMFMGPLESEKPWSAEGVSGCEKFLRRLWLFLVDDQNQLRLIHQDGTLEKKHLAIDRALNKALKRVNESFENFNFNIAIAAMMEALNEIQETQIYFTQAQAEFFVKMLAPFAPHISSEIWERMGNKNIDHASWPILNQEMLAQSEFELVMQVNGKIRKKLILPLGLTNSEVETITDRELEVFTSGKQVLKKIYVPNKLMNYVVR